MTTATKGKGKVADNQAVSILAKMSVSDKRNLLRELIGEDEIESVRALRKSRTERRMKRAIEERVDILVGVSAPDEGSKLKADTKLKADYDKLNGALVQFLAGVTTVATEQVTAEHTDTDSLFADDEEDESAA